jgi:methionyl-tRNA formyltransferase
MRVVFMGSGAFGLPTLQRLAQAAGVEIPLIVSQPDRPAGRGKVLTPTPVAAWALAEGRHLIRHDNINDSTGLQAIAQARPDVLVVIAFGQKLSPELLHLAPHGGINLHSSLLPKYRGAAPIHWAILNDDRETGVSVIRVTEIMDGGDVLARVATTIGPEETTGSLHDRLALLGAPLINQVLEAIRTDTLQPETQNLTQACKAPKLQRTMAWVDFNAPARAVSAKIRGLSPWPGIAVQVCQSDGQVRTQATLLTVRVETEQGTPGQPGRFIDANCVACGQGAIRILALQPQGKKALNMENFVNGYGVQAGWSLQSVLTPPVPEKVTV